MTRDTGHTGCTQGRGCRPLALFLPACRGGRARGAGQGGTMNSRLKRSVRSLTSAMSAVKPSSNRDMLADDDICDYIADDDQEVHASHESSHRLSHAASGSRLTVRELRSSVGASQMRGWVMRERSSRLRMDFHREWIELDGVRLTWRKLQTAAPSATAVLEGCSVSVPKKARRDSSGRVMSWTVRVDLARPDSVGQSKYVIDFGTGEQRRRWWQELAHASNASKDIEAFGVDDVAQSLRALNLSDPGGQDLGEIFRQHEVDGESLLTLTRRQALSSVIPDPQLIAAVAQHVEELHARRERFGAAADQVTPGEGQLRDHGCGPAAGGGLSLSLVETAEAAHPGIEVEAAATDEAALSLTEASVLTALTPRSGRKKGDRVAEMRALFSHAKTEPGGGGEVLTRGDVRRWVHEATGRAPTERDVDRLVAELDTDHDGTVDFTEFCNYMEKNQHGEMGAVLTNTAGLVTKRKAMFAAAFSEDRQGRVEMARQDVRRWSMEASGVAPTDRQVDHLMREMDTNRDGNIDFAEFAAYVERKPRDVMVVHLENKVGQLINSMEAKSPRADEDHRTGRRWRKANAMLRFTMPAYDL
eukprot:COSAG01_NODE_6626_length_3571_cov_5.948445_5_plen_588_part_00